jgi:hypothetical protein
MHPLSLFPSFFTYELVAPFLLRVIVGIFIIWKGWQRYGKIYKWSSVAYFVTGILLVIGLYMQAAAILGMLVLWFDYRSDNKVSPFSKEALLLYVFSWVVLFSLLFLGPGFFAMDLPL